MPMKEWFRRLQPVNLYVILTLTVIFFIAELIISHLTHAVTLLMDSYHTLCNIFALLTCIVTVKYGIKNCATPDTPVEDGGNTEVVLTCARLEETQTNRGVRENRLKNTFGWARIDVIGLLICCVLLASFSFSIVIEAAQTLVHITHHDEVHHAIPLFCVAVAGLVLNGICYFLIGGYTFHQGSFLYMNAEGCVVLNRVVTNCSVSRGERRLSRTRTVPPPTYRQRQGFKEMLRDVIGCILVIICSVLVYISKPHMAKFIDPILAIVSAAILMILSYPYMKESCLILLQTIPDTINIESLRTQLLEHFPDILNVHDLHIWQLTASKVISTAHIIFKNPNVHARIMSSVIEFFQEYGITQVTIQPEFYLKHGSVDAIDSADLRCLMLCQSEFCKSSICCLEDASENVETIKEKTSKKSVQINTENDSNTSKC